MTDLRREQQQPDELCRELRPIYSTKRKEMNFDTWWHQEGSGIIPNDIPNDKEDMEEFAKRIAKIAWSNGAYTEREACAKLCDEALLELKETVNQLKASEYIAQCVVEGAIAQAEKLSKAIRARSKHD